MSQATIPDLPFNGTLPDTVLFEISNSGVSESTDLSSIVFGLQEVSEKDQPNGYAGLDGSGFLNAAQIPDLSGTYQVITEKNVANGYAGLDASGDVLLSVIPQLPESRVDNLVTDLAARELLANKVTSVGTPGDDTNYPTEKATRDALDLKEDNLGFTPENIINKVTSVGTPGNDTNYPSEKATRDALDLKQDTLLFTPEDVANKVTVVGNPGDDTNYPTEKATRDALNLKEDSLGFTPEDVANKATDLLTPDNTDYPTTLAVTTFALQYQLLNEKGAVSGYAGLDASQELLLANFPSGSALQVLRRNAGNNALEFATVAAGGSQTPWTSDIDAAGFALLDANYIQASNGLGGPFASDGAIRLATDNQILWRNGGDNGDVGFQADDVELSFIGWTSLVINEALFTADWGNAEFTGIENFELNGAGEMDLADSILRSPAMILFSASDQEQAISLGNTEVISWQKLAGTGYAGVSSNASNQFVIGFSAASPGALLAAFTFTETAFDLLNHNIQNGDYIELGSTLATPFADAGQIRLPDFGSIAWRNSANDGNYTISIDDQTLIFDGWETIEMQTATLIDASAAVLEVLEIETGGMINVNGFEIIGVGWMEDDGSQPASAGFIRMSNNVSLAWSNFAEDADFTLKVNTSDQFVFDTTLTMNNNLIKAVLAPVDGTDAANKTYVDNLVNGLEWHDAAIIATTGDITLSGEQTIDGVLTSTTRVLVKNQTLGEDNGVYDSAAGAWTRSTDADTDVELNNLTIFVEQGVTNEGSSWTQTTDLPITVGTTVLVFAQVGAGPNNPLTTKGDIYGYDTENKRIPVGTDGQLLVANSAVALGVEWQDIDLPLTTKGDLFTFTTVNARLPVGITNQILSANSAEATGLEWIDNDVSPLTSKGDIFTFTTVNERIAVGTNGQVLSANSAQPTGLEWITLPSPGIGDVVGPAGATDEAVALYDGATGKLIKNSTLIYQTSTSQIQVPGAIVFTAAGTVPAGTNTYIREDGSDMDINVTSAGTIFLQYGTSQQYQFTSTQADFTGNTIVNALYEGTLADVIVAVASGLGSGITYNNGIKQTFNPSGSNAGLNVGQEALGGDPASPVEGDIYYNSTSDKFRAYENSTWVDMIGGGGAVNSISQLDTSITVTDTGTDGLANVVIDGASVLTIDSDATRMDQRFELNKASTISNISSSVATLNNEGNLFDFNNTVATFNSIASTGWQPGSVIYLQFTTADATGIELIHDFAASNPQEPFWLLNETNYTVNNTNNNQILSFIYDGTYWVQQAFGEFSAGDVSGPGSSTDNAIARFDLTTGKIIQNSTVTIDDDADIQNIRSVQFQLQNALPTASTEYIQVTNSKMQFNVQSGLDYNFSINAVQFFLIDETTGISLNTNDFRFANLAQGIIIDHAMTWNNFRQIFTPGASVSGINVGEQASDPTVPVDGDLYYQTGVGFRARDAGAWITLGAGGGTGDVVGPASSVNHNIAVFDGATGKLIDGAGSSGFEIIVDVAGQPTYPRNTIYTSFAVAPPGATVGFIGNYSSVMTINGNLGVTLHTQNVARLTANATDVLINDLNLRIGTGFMELEEITVPATPGANIGRLYTKDVSTVTHLFFIDSNGTETDLTSGSGGSDTPWTEDHDAAGFDLLFKTANPISMGQGATDLLSITFLDDTVGAGVQIGNTDGYVSFTNQSAVVGDNQMEFEMRSGGATTIQNVMNFQIVDDSGTIPNLLMNFQDSAGGSLTRPLLAINVNATEFVRILPTTEWTFHTATNLKDMGKITLANSSTTAAADRVINLDEADRITWDGATAGTPNSILFTTGDIFQVFINNALQFQITDTTVNFLNGTLQGVAGYEFQSSTADMVGTATDLELNGPTNVSIHIADAQKFFFNSSFLDMGNVHIKNLNSIRDVITGTPIQLKFEGVTSAVNYVEIVNAISAEGPTLSANGSDASVDLIFASKGTNGVLSMADYVVLDTNIQQKKGPNIASASNFAPREGNFFDVTGSTTINYIVDEIFWQAGSQITLQFDSAVTLTHNAGSDPGNFASMLLTGDADFDALAGDLITLVFDGAFWLEVSRSSVGAAAGDVSGPASATNNAVARFDLTTGKLIQNSAVTLGDLGEFNGATLLGMVAGATEPAGSTAYIWLDAGGMVINVPTSDTVAVAINSNEIYTFNATSLSFLNRDITTIGTIEWGNGGAPSLGSTSAIWNDTTLGLGFNVPTGDEFRYFINNVETMSISTSILDLKSKIIQNVTEIQNCEGVRFDDDATQIGSTLSFIQRTNSQLILHSPTGEDIELAINGLPELTVALNQLTINPATDLLAGGDVVVSDRFQGQKGPDVAGATTITLGDGNYFDITGSGTINHMTITNWQNGSVVTLQFDTTGTINHNTGTNPANTVSFFLAGAANFSATAGDTITLCYDGTVWRELARSIN